MLKAFVCYFDECFIEDQKWELVYAPTEEIARQYYEKQHGELPNICDPLPHLDGKFSPNFPIEEGRAYFSRKLSLLREAGAVFEDDPTCAECGEYWHHEKPGFDYDNDICPDCKEMAPYV